MADKPKGLEVGEPIWVESLLTREEWKDNFQKYATCILSEPPMYDENEYKGGKWRNSK